MISVIVPIYNVEEYLPACIESIINQTYKDLEILLIDDGSTDNSGKICDEYAKQDGRCIVIHQQNKGLSGARNTGLDHATGEYISFIDGDDYIHPQMLEILYEALQKGDYDFSMVTFKQVWKYCKEDITVTINNTFTANRLSLMKRLYNVNDQKLKWSEMNFQVVWNKLYKKSLISNLRFKQTGTEDTEFNNQVYLKTNSALLVNVPLYYWVQRPSSITHQLINQNFINRAYSYLICLHEIPVENNLYRAFCLQKLYKTIINIRYRSEKTKWNNYTISQFLILKRQTIKEFVRNKHICLSKKIGLLLFLYIPKTYNCFMFINESIYKLKK
ncbi:glycosyltransferase family 2 protein [Phocaeicola sp. HCN-6420]|uniref:glycosyltransferase family 2 protein n=1 Tax=Phocaeicola sp. HCN-6420 TaxID=3134673 RepID=UPI0030C5D8F6